MTKRRLKTYGTIKEGGWVWKSIWWSLYRPWADDAARFIQKFGLHAMVLKKRHGFYHVFVPEHELAPIPGILAKLSAR